VETISSETDSGSSSVNQRSWPILFEQTCRNILSVCKLLLKRKTGCRMVIAEVMGGKRP